MVTWDCSFVCLLFVVDAVIELWLLSEMPDEIPLRVFLPSGAILLPCHGKTNCNVVYSRLLRPHCELARHLPQ